MGSPTNYQVPRYFTRYYHQGAEATDALMSPWPQGLLYVFPPIPLIPKVLRKVRLLKAVIILVAPRWPRHPWFFMLQSMSVRTPLDLPLFPDILTQGQIWHPEPERLHLTAWKLKGDLY